MPTKMGRIPIKLMGNPKNRTMGNSHHSSAMMATQIRNKVGGKSFFILFVILLANTTHVELMGAADGGPAQWVC